MILSCSDSMWSMVRRMRSSRWSNVMPGWSLARRFLEEKSFAEVGAALGTSEAAAKMRVGRALEKLRAAFAQKRVIVPASALAVALSACGAPAAPAGLSTSVARAALGQQASSNLLLSETLKAMKWTKLKSTAVAGVLTLLFAACVVVLWQNINQRMHRQSLVVATFDPMAGEWEGIFELRGDDLPAAVRQTAKLTI